MLKTYQDPPHVAFFCMEYGLSHELPIYAGGLGILAGDILKTARDLNLPMTGIGILWRQDYTKQLINEEGYPYDVYPNYNYRFLEDTGVEVKLTIREEDITCRVRRVTQYDNAPLYLLDTNFPGSKHGWMTEKLYGGGTEERIAQEMILGIGGVRALKALDIDVDIYHFNEGHAAFAGLELLKEHIERQNLTFSEALETVRKKVVFTTHTPVGEANETHEHEILEHMGVFNGLNPEQMRFMGGEPFSMTAAVLRMAGIANGVSDLHGQTAREMWKEVDGRSPIISVTNGVHVSTWQDREIGRNFEQGRRLWPRHRQLKEQLISFVRERTGSQLDPNILTIGFARRAAPYKRSELIFRDTHRIDPLLRQDKIQLIFSGKAHPSDEKGKRIVSNLVKMDQHYDNRVVFIENYNMEIARYMVQGCDVWLNNPRRPLEASGTSGMKAALNGTLNLSVIDGWMAEGPIHGVSAWLIDEILHPRLDHHKQDEYDLKAIYTALYDEVIPTYYDDREQWEKMMRASIDMSCWKFSTERMLKEYYDRMYLKVFRAQDRHSRERQSEFSWR